MAGDFVSANQVTLFAWGFACAMLGVGVGIIAGDAMRMELKRLRRHHRRRTRRL